MTSGDMGQLRSLEAVFLLGDITVQGFPYYSGCLSYCLEGLEEKHLHVRVPQWAIQRYMKLNRVSWVIQ